jgi:hypothetical protein
MERVSETYAGETTMNDDMPWVNLTLTDEEYANLFPVEEDAL